ncbi:hypothetical protein CVD28_02460 [Bacillus sp. M6-12]|uniref:YncE family protein n=1 Tax=Bacillus sp. M6-12 TaxID=2054166 RepID=UPI000C78FBBA|nr:hypothetical protein [Bacillus sp. M6-12]PLS19295.1 hypothetical protein CVD28_02460 [Bacillus sp. M6-12]
MEKQLRKSTRKNVSSSFLAGMIFVVAVTPSYAEESKTTKVVGTFEATILDVSVPAVNTFIYNPNTEQMTTQNLDVVSNTNAPIYMNMKEINVSQESSWKPNLIAPATYTAEQWRNLTTDKTQKEVALGVHALEGDNWLFDLNNQTIWSNETVSKNKVGTLKNHGNIEVQPVLKSGNAIPAQSILTTNYIFEFGLEEGEYLSSILDFSHTILDSSHAELFATVSNAISPNIIGDELFVVDYFRPHTIYVYDKNTKALKRTMTYSGVQTISGGSQRFYSLGNDGTNLLAFRSSTKIDVIDKTSGQIIGTKTLNKAVSHPELYGSPTFQVKDGYLYVTPYYSTKLYIFDYATGSFIKEIGGFSSTNGTAIHGSTLLVSESNNNNIHVFNISDPINPIKETTLTLNNGYVNEGIAVDNDYIYMATYQNNKVIRHSLK